MLPPSLAEAMQAYKEGRFSQARPIVLAALDEDPTSLSHWELLALVSTGENDFTAAKRAYRHILSLEPASATSWHSLAVIQQKQDRSGTLQSALNRAAHCAPNAQTWVSLGTVQLQEGDWVKASRTLSLAVEFGAILPPEFLSALGEGYSQLADDALTRQDLAAARTYSRKASVLSPDQPALLPRIALLETDLDRYLRRIRALSKPQNGFLQYALELLHRNNRSQDVAHWLAENAERILENSDLLRKPEIEHIDTIEVLAMRCTLDKLLMIGAFGEVFALIQKTGDKLGSWLRAHQAGSSPDRHPIAFAVSLLYSGSFMRQQIAIWLHGLDPSVMQPTETKTFVVNVPIWGEAYLERFVSIQIPCFAQSMEAFLQNRPDSRFILQICTTNESKPYLENAILSSPIVELCDVEFRTPIDDAWIEAEPRLYAVTSQTCAILEARWFGRHVFPLHPNCYFEKNFFHRVVSLCEDNDTLLLLNPSIFYLPDQVEKLRALEEGCDRETFFAACSAELESMVSVRLRVAEADISKNEIPAELGLLFMAYDGFYAMRFLQLPPIYVSADLIQKLPFLHWSSYDDRFMEGVLHTVQNESRVGVVQSWEQVFYVSLEYLKQVRSDESLKSRVSSTEDFVKDYCDAIEAQAFCTHSRATLFRKEMVTSAKAVERSRDLQRYRRDQETLDRIADEIDRRVKNLEDVSRDYRVHVEVMQHMLQKSSAPSPV
jgi:Tfp pilus assembly protein PilF